MAQNTTCANMQQICQTNGVSFQALSNSNIPASGNNYSCLPSIANPNWFFFNISASGNIDLAFVSPIGTDLDFALWGPFTSQQAAINACGSLGNSPNPIGTVDCGALGGNTENINIPGANVGEVYVLLIVDYLSLSPSFTLNQTGGAGAVGCSPCPQGTTLQLSHSIIENPSCKLSIDGSAAVSAVSLLNGMPTNSSVTDLIWTSPTGTIYAGGPENDTLVNMEEGLWTVSAEDSCFNFETVQFSLSAPLFPDINLQYLDGILTTDFISYDSANTSYQWFNCTNDSITGEVNDTLEVLANGDYSLSISINGCTNFSDCYTVTGLALAESNHQTISILYDQTFKKLYIDSEVEISHIYIYNIGGKLIHHSNSTNIDLSYIVSGIYLVEIKSEESHLVQKIVLR